MAGGVSTVMVARKKSRPVVSTRDKDLVACGEQVRKARLAQGLTIRALAQNTGVSTSAIEALENGKQWMHIKRLLVLLRALNLLDSPLSSLVVKEPESPLSKLYRVLPEIAPKDQDLLLRFIMGYRKDDLRDAQQPCPSPC